MYELFEYLEALRSVPLADIWQQVGDGSPPFNQNRDANQTASDRSDRFPFRWVLVTMLADAIDSTLTDRTWILADPTGLLGLG